MRSKVTINSLAIDPLRPHLFLTGGSDPLGTCAGTQMRYFSATVVQSCALHPFLTGGSERLSAPVEPQLKATARHLWRPLLQSCRKTVRSDAYGQHSLCWAVVRVCTWHLRSAAVQVTVGKQSHRALSQPLNNP